MMIACGTMEQLCACGLKTIEDQMKLRKLFADLRCEAGASTPTSTLSISSGSSHNSHDRKLTLTEMKTLSP